MVDYEAVFGLLSLRGHLDVDCTEVGLNVARILQLTNANLEKALLAILTPLGQICGEAGLDVDETTFEVKLKAIEESGTEGDGFADRARAVLLRMGKPDN